MDERKGFELKKLGDDGTGIAQIATMSAVDHDGDTYAKGAFGEQEVQVLAGHSWAGVPLGKGRVFEKNDKAIAEFKLNLDTTAGQEWHKALKFDLDHGRPLTEWSYGFKVIESSEEVRDGKAVRVLESLDVHEVSPVVKGAGIDTGTVSLKSRKTFIADSDELIEAAERMAAERIADGKPLRAAWLMQLKALRDRIEHLLDDVRADEPTDQAEAQHLLAEFSRVSVGVGRWDSAPAGFCKVDGVNIKGDRLGGMIAELRESRDTTNAAIGTAAGISASTVGQIVGGSINCPPLPRLAGMARHLGTSLARLRGAAEGDGCEYD